MEPEPGDEKLVLTRSSGLREVFLDGWEYLLSRVVKDSADAYLPGDRPRKVSSVDAKKLAQALLRLARKQRYSAKSGVGSLEDFDTQAGKRELFDIIEFCGKGAFAIHRKP